ncbi:MAG: N-acetyltransferase [Acidimicrobiales bacterium]
MPVIVREFRRSDRDQLTGLINLHVAAVLPGTALSTNVVLGQLEREPEELIVDPWVNERVCLVAEVDNQVVAATLLHRFSGDDSVADGYRSAARIRWFLFAPDADEAAKTLIDTALDLARRWKPTHLYVESALPALGCVGISTSWPHVSQALHQAGFAGPSRSETVLACDCESLARNGNDVTTKRSVGALGTRLDLMDGDQSLGYIEVAPAGLSLQRSSTATTWADIGNLFAADADDLPQVMPALIGAAAQWLQLGGINRLVDYYAPDFHGPQYLDTLIALGFTELTTNRRGWEL